LTSSRTLSAIWKIASGVSRDNHHGFASFENAGSAMKAKALKAVSVANAPETIPNTASALGMCRDLSHR
jgi:hypothetical protein